MHSCELAVGGDLDEARDCEEGEYSPPAGWSHVAKPRDRCESERVAGIEPALQSWKDRLRPLQHTRIDGR